MLCYCTLLVLPSFLIGQAYHKCLLNVFCYHYYDHLQSNKANQLQSSDCWTESLRIPPVNTVPHGGQIESSVKEAGLRAQLRTLCDKENKPVCNTSLSPSKSQL